jgi:hypothetical protein
MNFNICIVLPTDKQKEPDQKPGSFCLSVGLW